MLCFSRKASLINICTHCSSSLSGTSNPCLYYFHNTGWAANTIQRCLPASIKNKANNTGYSYLINSLDCVNISSKIIFAKSEADTIETCASLIQWYGSLSIEPHFIHLCISLIKLQHEETRDVKFP